MNTTYTLDPDFEALLQKHCPEKHHHYCRSCLHMMGVGNRTLKRTSNGAAGVPCTETTHHAHGLCMLCSLLSALFAQGRTIDGAADLVTWWTKNHGRKDLVAIERKALAALRAV